MKVPLRYQVTEYDCGTTSLVNALAFLYECEELPVELLRAVFNYSIDDFGKDANGRPEQGASGTSVEAMGLIAHWVNDFSHTTGFKIHAKQLLKSQVTEEAIRHAVRPGSVAVVRVHLSGGHYVLVTKIKNDKVYVYDPYYSDGERYKNNPNIEFVADRPFEHNRVINAQHFFSENHGVLGMGNSERREAVVIAR
jgi:hypothetical protein